MMVWDLIVIKNCESILVRKTMSAIAWLCEHRATMLGAHALTLSVRWVSVACYNLSMKAGAVAERLKATVC